MKWKHEKRKIKDLYELAKNARKLTKEQAAHLYTSIDKFGQCEPIVINTDDVIIGGHQRLRTMRKMGYKEVDVYVPDTPLNSKEVEELNIRLNKNSGDWDWDILGNAWDPEDLLEWGFTMEDLHLEELPPSEGGEGEDSPPKKCSMTIHFIDVGHLQEAENNIAPIVESYVGATYKVKVK
jgi:hypothetical protein